MGRLGAATTALWLLTASSSIAGQGGVPPRPAPAPTPAAPQVGTGVIAGHLTAGDTGRPLRRVRVTLSTTTPVGIIGTAVTDLEGRFRFAQLPAGAFTLKAVRTGYLETLYGQVTPGSGRPGTPITLAEAQRVETIAMAMPRGGVISGVVLDEVGDPAPSVPVRAMRFNWRNGVRELVSGAGATTDDRGHYRIGMLIPGEYVVCAMPRDEIVLAVTLYEEMRNRGQLVMAAQTARLGADSAEARAMAARAAAAQGPPPDQPREAYVPVCFPSTRQMTQAATLTLGVSEERGGTDLRLQIEPIAKVSGTVSWSGGTIPIGNTASDTTIWLVDKSSVPGGATDRVTHATANGAFAFQNVAPGEYTLRANATVPQSGPSSGSATTEARGTPTMELAAIADIVITGQPLANVRLTLERGATIVGRLVGEGVSQAELSRIRITASPVGSFVGEMAPAIGTPDAQGRFTLVGVVPGRFRIHAYGAMPPGMAIKSSVFGAQDTLEMPIEIRPGEPVPEGVITVIPRLAEITGQVESRTGQPASGLTVIAFPSDARLWVPQSRRIQSVRPGTDGTFTVKDLPAGEYRLAAVTDVEPGRWFDATFLRELVAASVAVTVVEGQRTVQSLRVGR